MARARNIKPSFFQNEDLVEVSYAARLLFIGLWTIADREGRLEDRPKRIKMQLFPADDIDIDAELNALQERQFILRYTHGDDRYIQVINFGKHQNPHIKEAESTIPAPDEHGASTVQAPTKADASHADSLNSESREGATDKPSRARPVNNDMWDAFTNSLGTEPKTKSERGKWNGAIKELVEAEITPEQIPSLVSQYRVVYGHDVDCNPKAIANNLSKIQARGSPNGTRSRYRSLDEIRAEQRAAMEELANEPMP